MKHGLRAFREEGCRCSECWDVVSETNLVLDYMMAGNSVPEASKLAGAEVTRQAMDLRIRQVSPDFVGALHKIRMFQNEVQRAVRWTPCRICGRESPNPATCSERCYALWYAIAYHADDERARMQLRAKAKWLKTHSDNPFELDWADEVLANDGKRVTDRRWITEGSLAWQAALVSLHCGTELFDELSDKLQATIRDAYDPDNVPDYGET